MVKKFQYPQWNELSPTQQVLVREWVSVALHAQRIREALLAEATGEKVDISSIQFGQSEVFDIVESEDGGVSAPLESVTPRIPFFLKKVQSLKTCQDSCNKLSGAERDNCLRNCQQVLVATMF